MSQLIRKLIPGIATSTDNALVRWDGATGQFVQNSIVILNDAGEATGYKSITIKDITWNDVNLFASAADMSFTANGTLTFNVGPAAANLNIVAFNGDVVVAASATVTFAGNDIDFSTAVNDITFTSATTISFATGSNGNITLSPNGTGAVAFVMGGQTHTLAGTGFTTDVADFIMTIPAAGIFSVDANTFRIHNTNNRASMNLGGSAPSELFHAKNASGSRAAFQFEALNSSTNVIVKLLDQAGNHWQMAWLNATRLRYLYNNVDKIVFHDGTDSILGVGIGNTDPAAAAHVRASVSDAEVFRLETATASNDPNYRVFQARVATTDATPTTLATINITAGETVLIESRIVARRTGGALGTAEDGAGYIRYSTYKTVAGVVTLIGALTLPYTAEDQVLWNAAHVIAGATVVVQVTGAASNDITWHCTSIVQNLAS